MSLFVVVRTHGPRWLTGKPLEAQQGWTAHASFMDDLEREGFVLLAGPLGENDALLVVRANSAEEVGTRLEADPWTTLELLRTTQIAEWTLRLGSLR